MSRGHERHYEIRLPFVKVVKNPQQNEIPTDVPFLIVGPNSPLAWRKAAENLACYFRREFGYDFVQYQATECHHDWSLAKDRVLVFAKKSVNTSFEDVFCFFGAVSVRWIKWSNAPPSWSIEWVWFHPYERGKGHMTKAWPFILQMFPEPSVAPPISPAMKSFLVKVGYTKPLGGTAP